MAFTEGDPIHVTKMYDDLWYEGINITTGKHGLFPCRYVADIMAEEDVESAIDDALDHKQFHLRYGVSVQFCSFTKTDGHFFLELKMLIMTNCQFHHYFVQISRLSGSAGSQRRRNFTLCHCQGKL